MDIKPEDLLRSRVFLALRKFSPAVLSDVLADGTIAPRFDVPVSQPVQLSQQHSVDRTLLFTAFEKAADNLPMPPLVNEKGEPLALEITISADSAVVAHQDKRWVFAHAALLSSDPSRRAIILARILSRNTLTNQDRVRLESLIAKDDYSHGDFIAAAGILASSPESFVASIREKATTGRFSMRDLLPQHSAHWSNLTAPPGQSMTLDEFVAVELSAERKAQIDRNPADALAAIALTFASPALVPRDLFKDVSSDAMLTAIDRVAETDVSFALSGTFDLCVDRVVADPRFVAAGEKILDKLFGDMGRLNTACDLFGAVFVVATAYLAEHETLRRQPVYWRRLAAASHAGLVVRTLGVGKSDEEPLLTWATRVRGKTYFLSVLNEFAVEPRWRPDWIVPRFLVADVYGRAIASAHRLQAGELPAGWQQRLDAAQSWMTANKFTSLAYYPALLEGARRPIPKLQELGQVKEAYQLLIDEPSPEALLMLTPAVQALGFSAEAADAVWKIVNSLRIDASKFHDEIARAVMSLSTDIAVQIRDTRLADLVADVSVELCVNGQDRKSLTEAVFRIIECAAANADREEAQATLGRRMENLASLLPPTALANLMEVLRTLQMLDERLAVHLGRAVAIARLGVPRIAAA